MNKFWKLILYFGEGVEPMEVIGPYEEVQRHIKTVAFKNQDCIHFECHRVLDRDNITEFVIPKTK